jgi:hypothetical protein
VRGSLLDRKYTFLFIIILFGLLSSCGLLDGDKTDKSKTSEINGIEKTVSNFVGIIKDINGHRAIVNAKIGGGEGDVFVDLSVNSDETFQVGDKIKVEYDGPILESNPAQINTLSVELIE